MTVVRPNSIAGINSITVQTGQALNIHDASGNLIRNITSSTGISTFASINVTQGSGDLTVGVSTLFVDNSTGRIGIGTDVPDSKLDVNGNITATKYYGDGSELTGVVASSMSSSPNIITEDDTKIEINDSNTNGYKLNVLGVESKLEQILANLLDNAISFSPPDSKIIVTCGIIKNKAQLIIEDEGPGFNEKNIDKVFNRFYSNRPEKFGEHSGLGLNIVKNIIELHGGSIIASNHITGKKGAKIEVQMPIYK